jgi:hypothetical protein
MTAGQHDVARSIKEQLSSSGNRETEANVRLLDEELSERDENGNALVQIDRELCRAVAERIKQNDVPEDREDIELRDIPPELLGNFFLALVAICHQTSPMGGPRLEGIVHGTRRAGWDYLLGRLHERAISDHSLLYPPTWATMTSVRLGSLFADPKFGSLLSVLPQRAALLRDLGNGMIQRGWERADDMFVACGSRIACGDPNLLDTLATFHAYRDPVRKKTLFFLSLMRNTGHWQFADDQALRPPVDYHEVRGHLRIGTVRIVDRNLLDKVSHGIEVTEAEDVAIRRAVLNAILLISEYSGIRDPSRMHYLFWNVFRGVCTRDQPRCSSTERPPLLPSRYLSQLDVDTLYHCPFERICRSAHAPSPMTEHKFTTDYY